jgi:hypothetical protein
VTQSTENILLFQASIQVARQTRIAKQMAVWHSLAELSGRPLSTGTGNTDSEKKLIGEINPE